MASLLASNLAGLVAIALEQAPDGARLSDIARAVGTGPSGVQRALQLLTANGIIQTNMILGMAFAEAVAIYALATVAPEVSLPAGLDLRRRSRSRFVATRYR